MNKQFNNLFNSVDLSQKWNALMLSNIQQWVALRFDYVQESVESASQQLRTALAGLNEIHDTSCWSDISQAGATNAIEATRELIQAATDLQIEAQQLFREQLAEGQKLLEASLTQSFSHLEAIETGFSQGNKNSVIAQKIAA